MSNKNIHDKFKSLENFIKLYNQAIVAFSGGIDSFLLYFLCNRILGANACAVIVKSPFLSRRDFTFAVNQLKKLGARYRIIDAELLQNPRIRDNNCERCYWCKRTIFQEVSREWNGEDKTILFDGSNIDDLNEDRPGLRALKEFNINSPYIVFSISKKEIRAYAKHLKIEFWDKPSNSCIATRIPFGTALDEKKIKTVENSEEVLFQLGFSRFRVRFHNELARICISENDYRRILEKDVRDEIFRRFLELGFRHVSVDLIGYKS